MPLLSISFSRTTGLHTGLLASLHRTRTRTRTLASWLSSRSHNRNVSTKQTWKIIRFSRLEGPAPRCTALFDSRSFSPVLPNLRIRHQIHVYAHSRSGDPLLLCLCAPYTLTAFLPPRTFPLYMAVLKCPKSANVPTSVSPPRRCRCFPALYRPCTLATTPMPQRANPQLSCTEALDLGEHRLTHPSQWVLYYRQSASNSEALRSARLLFDVLVHILPSL